MRATTKPYSLIVLLLVASAVGGAKADDLAVERLARLEAVASNAARGLATSKWEEVSKHYDDQMADKLPDDKLAEIWQSVSQQFGPLKEVVGTRHERIKDYEVIFVTCSFERGVLDLKLVFNKSDKISGLFLVPTGQYSPPKYARPETVKSREVSVGRGLLNLPGTLVLPKDASTEKPVAAVVLVHGSGPNDRDETIGPNKPFLDLAHGLSARGIAVLRYEKRTKQYPVVLSMISSTLTVREETVDDVLSAIDLLARQPEIDPQRIVVLGHSLGGMLIPRIAQRTTKVAGFISLAGSTRPFEDIILDQTETILKSAGELTDESRETLNKLKAQVELVKSDKLSRQTPASELPLGVPAAYWLDLRGYQPAVEAKKITRPLLILHAGRDYQVTAADFKLWQDALNGRDNCTLREYPKLNHLFIAGEGPSTPTEYTRPGNIEPQVIDDIADWINTSISPSNNHKTGAASK